MKTTKRAAIALLSLALLQGCGGGGSSSSGGGAPLPAADHDLAAGASMNFPFQVQAGGVYSVTMQRITCDGGLCCSMRATGGGFQGSQFLQETAPDPADSMARLLLEPSIGGQINVRVTALNRCRFNTPVMASVANVAAAQAEVDATGQQPNMDSGHGMPQRFARMDVSRVGNRIYLHDTSRRGTSLASNASISTLKFLRNTANRAEARQIIHQAANAGALDKAAVDAHGYTQAIHDYFKAELGRNSYDNNGGSMLSFTHFDFPIQQTVFCNNEVQPGTLHNAFSFSGQGAVGFTDGFPDRNALPLSVALDVVAHEWGHAMSDSFIPPTGFEYERESGALAEAFADWMAVAVEDHIRGEGQDLCNSQGSCIKSVWTLGEDENAARAISHPNLVVRQGGEPSPDTYKGQHWEPADVAGCAIPDICVNDWCGVHTNNGVGNRMFYLLAEGGTSSSAVSVNGIGIQNAIEVALAAHRDYWTSTSDYAAARSGMVMAAEALDTANSTNWKQSVERAWTAVGVTGASRAATAGGR